MLADHYEEYLLNIKNHSKIGLINILEWFILGLGINYPNLQEGVAPFKRLFILAYLETLYRESNTIQFWGK